MPKGPRGEERRGDVISSAIRVMQVATGQREEEYEAVDEGKDKAAAELGRKGSAARAGNLCPERRQEIARKAAAKRG